MSSDMRRYFVFDESSCIRTGDCTILTEVRSKRKTPCFPTDYLFHRVVFSPYQSCMYLYEEKRQRKYKFGHDFSLTELGLTSHALVTETRLFFMRGHSVRNIVCTCNPRLSYERYLDYGLCSVRASTVVLDSSVLGNACVQCPLDSQSQSQFTCEEICRELGVSSLTETFIETPVRKTVHNILRHSGEFIHRTNAAGHETWELCGKHIVDDETSLLEYVQKNRLGVATNDRKLEYPLLGTDVRRLVHKAKLFHLPAQGMLYAVPGLHGQQKCDDDIVAMWKKCA